MADLDVVVAGGGPTGLMLAAELALAGVDVAVVERRPTQELEGMRAGGLHARTLEIFDQRGIVDRFVVEGQKSQSAGFAGVKLEITGFPTRHPYSLGLWQTHTERLLLDWVTELQVPIHRGIEVTGFVEDDTGVTVDLNNGTVLRTKYLVGCDGSRSAVRRAAGIGFVGAAATVSNLIAEAEMTGSPPLGVHRGPLGIHSFGRTAYRIVEGEVVFEEEGPIRMMVTEAEVGERGTPTLDDLRAALVAACGTDYGVHSPVSITRFTDATRQAARYRAGRVFVAGDAAHVHPPDGGQGLQLGVQDAVNLGWKLALAVKGQATGTLLDTYEQERHPVAARVLRHTLAAVALRRDDDRTRALREMFGDLLAVPEARRVLAGEMTQLGLRYDFGEGHPLLGRRMPDLEVRSDDSPVRVYSMMHRAQALLIDLRGGLDIGGWSDRVRTVRASYDGPWDLPVLGEVKAPSAVLVRPDGYVAWVGEGTDAGLAEALTRWFGPPAV